jgi:hypothetical protein
VTLINAKPKNKNQEMNHCTFFSFQKEEDNVIIII